jgi:hypothetical protein
MVSRPTFIDSPSSDQPDAVESSSARVSSAAS